MNSIPKRMMALIWTSLFLLALPLRGAVVTAGFNSAATVPVTAASYTATGNTVDISLNYAPVVGTNLTLVNNTGLGFIQGTFDNLAQGQRVTLAFGGIHYGFVANYFGGRGNDLVLQWANNRLLGWGANSYGGLGIDSTTGSSVPVAVAMTGVLAGKSIVAVAEGYLHSLALCSDGTVAAWGYNNYGQLGIGNTTNSQLPALVNRSGVLATKTVVAIAAGDSHSLALCSDGTVAAWGYNYYGQLGNASTTSSNVPVLVSASGVLAGKSVVAIAGGKSHSLVLCSDGSVAGWGYNSTGQLGNGSTTNSNVPVLVNRAGVLAAKTVVALACGASHSLALCADGSVAAWGANSAGQVGNGTTTIAIVPDMVSMAGVLAGKTAVAIAAGSNQNLVLCADGTLAAWGDDSSGMLGNNSTTNSSVPVLVDRSGVLAGKTVVAIAAGYIQGFAICSDGSAASWGYNYNGQLGNGTTTQSNVPTLVNTSALRSGERMVAGTIGSGSSFEIALVASSPLPEVSTLAVTAITDTGAALQGSVTANGSDASVAFEYGPTSAYGTTVAASPVLVSGSTITAASATLSGLLSGTTYHYRLVATNIGGTARGEDMTFTTSTLASLASLVPSSGTLVPAFDSQVTRYSFVLPFAATTLTMTPTVLYTGATVTVKGNPVASGTASGVLDLAVGNNPIDIGVTPAAGGFTKTYTVTVTRLPAAFTYTAASTVPVTVSEFAASGSVPPFALSYAPAVGTALTVVKNTGNNPIQGTFDNLPQGQLVQMTYAGQVYSFTANYGGGTGNDLVLQWANTRLLA